MLLVAAAGRLFSAGGPATMADVAGEAGISIATAYRHFSSVDEALAAHRFEVGRELLEFTTAQATCGVDLLARVCAQWVQLVAQHGSWECRPTARGRGWSARQDLS